MQGITHRAGLLAALLSVACIAWWLWPEDSALPGESQPPPPPANGGILPQPQERASEPERTALPAADVEAEPSAEPNTISGIVQDGSGRPISTARVLFRRSGSRETVHVASVEDDGRFIVRRAPSWGAKLIAAAEAPGFTNGRSSIPVDGFLAFVLTPTIHVHGRVLDAETKAPIGGATVSYWAEKVTSQADGSYRIGGIGIGHLESLVVRKQGYAPRHREVMQRKPEPVALDLYLKRGTKVSVTVIDSATGEPLADARVYDSYSLNTSAQDGQLFARTDAAGRFTMPVVDGTTRSVSILADGYCRFVWIWQVQEPGGIQPTVPMRPLGLLEGRVQDSNGNNLATVDVFTPVEAFLGERGVDELEHRHQLQGTASYHVAQGTQATGPDGRFRRHVVPSDQPIHVMASRRGYLAARSTVAVRPHSPAWIDLVLEEAALVRGRATYNDRPWRGSVRWKSTHSSAEGDADTDAEGIYAFSVVPGAVEISLLDGDLLVELHTTSLTAVAGRVHQHDIDVREALSTISGVVTNQGGELIANAKVWATSPEMRQFGTRTLGDGSYVLQVPRSSIYKVDASLEGHAETSVAVRKVAAGSSGVNLVLSKKKGRLRLQFLLASTGKPTGSSIKFDGAAYWKESSDASFREFGWGVGSRDIEGVMDLVFPMGTVDLSFDLSQSGYVPQLMTQLEVTDDPEPTPHVVKLTPGLEVELRMQGPKPLRTEPGNPLLFLLAESESGAVKGPYEQGSAQANHRLNGVPMWLTDPTLTSRRLLLDEEQRAVIRGLTPGRYRIHAFPPVVAFEPDAFQVSESNSTAEVRWQPAASGGR